MVLWLRIWVTAVTHFMLPVYLFWSQILLNVLLDDTQGNIHELLQSLLIIL